MRSQGETNSATRSPNLTREFLSEQLPLIMGVLGLGFAAAYVQHGFLPGADVAFPLAGVRVPIWHLIWMGFWTGYTMAIVGEAAGIFALPYTMSILQFTNPHVTPTTQLLTFLNPFGALFGFRRNKQWNLDLAAWVCLGGVVGGILGSWCAAKTQRFVPEHSLKLMLGGITGIAGTLYVWDFFIPLPFKM